MLSPTTRDYIREIMKRISQGITVTFEERLYLTEIADNDSTVANWLKKARRQQQNKSKTSYIDKLIEDLDIGSSDPTSTYNPERNNIEEWFGNAPSWVRRS